MHRPVVSKIRVFSQEKSGKHLADKEYCVYIATRPGVVLDQPDMSSNKKYVGYIARRPKSHGLFGNIDTRSLSAVSKEIDRQSSNGNPIFRGIVSLHEQDAKELGYFDQKQWKLLLHATMSDIAEKFHIPLERMQWVGAFHLEEGHPHVHYMFWDKEKVPRSSYIHSSRQQKCREIFSREIFAAERDEWAKEKTAARDLALELGESYAQLGKPVRNIPILEDAAIKIPDKITTSEVNTLSKMLQQLADQLPEHGSIKYAYMPYEVKETVNSIVRYISNRNDVKKELQKFLDSNEKIADTNSASKIRRARMRKKAIKDIKTRMGNKVLSVAKDIRNSQPPDPSKDSEYSLDTLPAFLKKELLQQEPRALFALGKLYEDPKFTDADLDKAELAYEKAAEHGISTALTALEKLQEKKKSALLQKQKENSILQKQDEIAVSEALCHHVKNEETEKNLPSQEVNRSSFEKKRNDSNIKGTIL